MNTLNTVPKTGTFGASVDAINANFTLVQEAVSEVVGVASKGKGAYASVSELETAHPTGTEGDWALVYNSTSDGYDVYTYTNGAWTQGGVFDSNILQGIIEQVTSSALSQINVAKDEAIEEVIASGGVTDIYSGESKDALIVVDNNNNAIARFDNDGLTTTKVKATHFVNADGQEITGGADGISSDYDNALIIVDNNNNAIARFDKDGLTTTSVQSKGFGFSDYQLISLGDSLSAGGAWQKVCAHALGCKYDETKERDANYPLSMPGVSNGGYAGIERVLNLFDLNIVQDDGANVILVIGNINDGYSGSISENAVSCHRKVTVTGSALTTSILSSIATADRVINYVLALSSGNTYIYIGDDLTSWTDTTKWAVIGDYMTTYRSIKTMIQAIISQYPKIHIMLAGFPSIYVSLADYLLPNGTYDNVSWYNSSRMDTGRKRNAMLRTIADFYTIPYLPVYEEEGITLENLTLYYYENNVHPKEDGYRHWGEVLARQIKKQF